jgi:hypothetical protein
MMLLVGTAVPQRVRLYQAQYLSEVVEGFA